MDYRFKLCFCRDIYDHKQNDRAFMEAVHRNVDCHLLKCEDYRRILESRGFSREDGKRVTDVGEVPCIPTLFFKYHDLHSMPESAMVVKATSSGTKGVKSHIGFDKKSLFFGGIAACRVIARHGLFSMRPARYSGVSARKGQSDGDQQDPAAQHDVCPGAQPAVCAAKGKERISARF